MKNFDVIIIGAGPIGLAAGIEAKKRNLSYLILEKGCLVNSIFNYPANMTFFSTSERLEIGDVPFISHGPKPTRTEALEYFRRVKESWALNVNVYEKVTSVSGSDGSFNVISEKDNYFARKVIVSSGFFDFPNYLNVKGEELPKVKHYYDEAHPYIGMKILVVGAGNSGVDVALETFRRGAEVTLIVKKGEIDPGVKYWVKPDIENRIKEDSIKAYFNSSVAEIREGEVDIQTPDGNVTLKNDFVLAMTGYHPDFDFLSRIGINLTIDEKKKPEYDPVTFETNAKGIYLAGVVCGGMVTNEWFIENSIVHARRIFEDISEKFTVSSNL
ncbi:MAG: YpdA family putative bacillithiol disulfide reductase [Melioribacteraceae bacterium]|nr:YpdA family putative bacillithiol disulfide reductase [Melioribacteraceae bacterium]MCF8265776.1 YpdA family putative bacillithiol disulfide reductase [Melioribacteraceae bacterium]MCF8431849.1 YpdA family putative bacillithiol disulfide reductase [Melioribacteraceae bacterium]